MTEHPTPADKPVPCWFCQAPVVPAPDGMLTATDPEDENPRHCPAHQSGHRTRLMTNWEDTPQMRDAWLAYDALARALPQCEHVTAWQAQTNEAKKAYHAAMKARDKLWTEQCQAELAAALAESEAAEAKADPP